MARLQGDAQQPFGADTAAIIAAKSPTSLKITLRQLREGAKLDFRECMRLEYRIVNRVLENAEFFEGVRAIIIDKDNTPHWNPARLEDVDAAAIEAYFAPLGDKELDLP